MAIELFTPSTNRPYPPASNVVAVLQRVRTRNLPDRIDQDYLRDAGITESLLNRVHFALRFLNLVDDVTPTEALRAIATSTDEEYQNVLAGLLKQSYAEVFQAVDPEKDPQDRIVNVFRRYTPASQRGRMVVFFLAMCREAGIPTLDSPRQSGMRDAAMAVRVPRSASRQVPPKKASVADSTRNRTSEERQSTGFPMPVELLLRSLPPEGAAMSSAKREQWLEMARATLAFVYPEEEGKARGEEVSDS